MAQWTDDEVAQQFRQEVQQKFAAENAAWLEEERAGIARAKAECDAKNEPYPDWLGEERDSFLWEIYSGSIINIDRNSVQVIAPRGYAICTDFVEMFSGTSVGWSVPSIGAEIIDGEARVTVELILIDYWDDERHAAWLAENSSAEART